MSKDELIMIAIHDLSGEKKGTIIDPKKSAIAFGLSEKDFFNEVIFPLLGSDKIFPIYKLNTDIYSPNDWVVSLFGLAKDFKLKDGTTLDGTLSKNIRTAYRVK
jgi:hypothetical protein